MRCAIPAVSYTHLIWAAVKGDYAPAKKLKYEPAGLALWGDGLTAEELRNKLSGLGESGLSLALRWDAELAGEELTELVQKNNLTRLLPALPEVAGREMCIRDSLQADRPAPGRSPCR